MTQSLFREEALRQQGERLWGALILSQPLSSAIFTLFLGTITAFALWFLVQHDYARKQTVKGMLVPDRGLLEIRAPVTGTIINLAATLDAQVAAGTPLFTVQIDHTLAGNDALTEQLLHEAATQRETLLAQLQLEETHAHALNAQFAERAALLEHRLQELAALIGNEELLLAVKRQAAVRAASLRDRGLLALADYDSVYAQQLQQQGALGQLQVQREQARADLAALAAEKTALLLASQREQQRLAGELAELRQQQLRLGAEQGTTVLAPVAGRITGVLQMQGMGVNAQQPVVALMPEGSQLEAELLLPSSAIGFVAAEQTVNVRYEAFPYQKFGMQQARVRTVAGSAELQTPAAGNAAMPVYRVLATLDEQSITAYGSEQPLRPGMALSADVITDRRSLLEWLLEPLFSIRGKS